MTIVEPETKTIAAPTLGEENSEFWTLTINSAKAAIRLFVDPLYRIAEQVASTASGPPRQIRTQKQAETEARRIVTSTLYVNGAIAWVPFSTVPLTFSEGLMVRRIARIFEVAVDDQDVSSVLALAAGAALGHGAGEAAKAAGLIFIHPIVQAAIVKAIGEAAIAYFAQRSSLPSDLAGHVG